MQRAAYCPLTPTSLILLLLQTSSSRFLPLSSIKISTFLPSPPSSFSLQASVSFPTQKQCLTCNDASQITKPAGIHDLINLTTTFTGRCCLHSAYDENEAKEHEVTCSKPHGCRVSEAGGDPCSFLQTSLHHSTFTH